MNTVQEAAIHSATMTDDVPHISDMRIVLLGNRRTGKSSSGNTILGKDEFNTSGRTYQCEKRKGEIEGRCITIVEAPDWWKHIYEEETTQSDKKEIVHSVCLCPPGPHALLLVIDVSESFTEAHRKAVQEHLELLGERVWSHTLVLFTKGDWLERTIEQHIESGGKALQWLVEKCGKRYHVFNNMEKDDRAQVTDLIWNIEVMVAENKGRFYEWDITQPVKQAASRRHPPEMAKSSGYSSGSFPPCDDKLTPLQMEKSTVLLTRLPFVDEKTIKILYDKLLGKGTFGRVYKGSYQGTPAAIKLIPIGQNPPDTLEFIIPLRLSHPHIVRMIAVNRTDSQILIANEYIHGGSLSQILHTDCHIKLDDEEKCCVALEIAMAVEYIHGKNVIHRDLKPANILVSERTKTAYLTDWGLANMHDSLSQLGVARHGNFCGPQGGTDFYAAPELLLNDIGGTTMSDMWSLGVTYLEMFTSLMPWTCKTSRELLVFLNNKELPHALANLQPCHDDIVKPLVEYDPQSRKTASDIMEVLKSRVDLITKYGFEW